MYLSSKWRILFEIGRLRPKPKLKIIERQCIRNFLNGHRDKQIKMMLGKNTTFLADAPSNPDCVPISLSIDLLFITYALFLLLKTAKTEHPLSLVHPVPIKQNRSAVSSFPAACSYCKSSGYFIAEDRLRK